MALDEQTRAFIARSTARPAPSPDDIELTEFRAAVEPFRSLLFDREELEEVRELTFPEPGGRQVAARFYRPESTSPAPLVVWAHGGSWVRVTVDLLDTSFRFIAARSGCAVLAVDYALSPESRFPTAVEEVHAGAVWAAAHGTEVGCDTSRIAIGGESSGGNLAAAVTLLARDRGSVDLQHQMLVLPVLDVLFESESWQQLGHDYLLTAAQLDWALTKYAPGEDRQQPLLSPLRASDLSGLPPATILLGEFDPLRSEGLAYAARLESAGIEVRIIDIEGLIHHAIMAPKALPRGYEAMAAVADALAESLGTR